MLQGNHKRRRSINPDDDSCRRIKSLRYRCRLYHMDDHKRHVHATLASTACCIMGVVPLVCTTGSAPATAANRHPLPPGTGRCPGRSCDRVLSRRNAAAVRAQQALYAAEGWPCPPRTKSSLLSSPRCLVGAPPQRVGKVTPVSLAAACLARTPVPA